MDGAPLIKQVQHARRRNAGWGALIAATAANVALALVLHAGPARAPMSVTVTVEAPPPAPAPVFAPRFVFVTRPAPEPWPVAPFADRGPCPAPHTAAPRGRLAQPDDTITHVAGAPTDSRWIAAWTGDRLYASHDGGARWARVLDGDGDVIDAGFDCHGRVLALRSRAGLGVRDGTRETWRTVPVQMQVEDEGLEPRYQAQLFGGSRAIAVVGTRPGLDYGEARAAVSDDLGTSWRVAELGYYEGETAVGGWRGDTLHLAMAWHDCMAEGTRVIAVAPDRTDVADRGPYATQYAMVGTTTIGASYECRDEQGTSPGLCALGDEWRPLAGVAGEPDEVQLVDGPVAAAIIDGQVHRVGARKLGRGRPWPIDARALGTDRAGRVWGTDASGALIRR